MLTTPLANMLALPKYCSLNRKLQLSRTFILTPAMCYINITQQQCHDKHLLFIHECLLKHVLNLLRKCYANSFQRKWFNLSFQKGPVIPTLEIKVKLTQKKTISNHLIPVSERQRSTETPAQRWKWRGRNAILIYQFCVKEQHLTFLWRESSSCHTENSLN